MHNASCHVTWRGLFGCSQPWRGQPWCSLTPSMTCVCVCVMGGDTAPGQPVITSTAMLGRQQAAAVCVTLHPTSHVIRLHTHTPHTCIKSSRACTHTSHACIHMPARLHGNTHLMAMGYTVAPRSKAPRLNSTQYSLFTHVPCRGRAHDRRMGHAQTEVRMKQGCGNGMVEGMGPKPCNPKVPGLHVKQWVQGAASLLLAVRRVQGAHIGFPGGSQGDGD